MEFKLRSEDMSLTVDTMGAQMKHLQSADGTEYLWQGDPAYWDGQAPNLFPFIGRLYGGECTSEGEVYPLGIHGFAAAQEFKPVLVESDRIVLELKSNVATYRQYPVHFIYRISYELFDNTLIISNRSRFSARLEIIRVLSKSS